MIPIQTTNAPHPSKKTLPFPLLYLVTDRSLAKGRSLLDIIASALEGGVSVVQLREKDLSSKEFYEEARFVKEYLKVRGVPLIINDRLDIALAVEAEGLHIGQSDLPYPIARKLLGKEALIGLSVDTPEELLEAQQYDVDYLGVGPVFPTATKETPKGFFWGIEGLKWAKDHSRHPLVAIGGISIENATRVVQSGVEGIAVVSALVAAADPGQAARQLFQALQQQRRVE